MHFTWSFNKDNMNVDFGQMDMNKSSTHLSITKRGHDDEYNYDYISESVDIYMSVEDAEEFIKRFQESLYKYKNRKFK